MHFLSAVTTFFGLILGPVHMEGGGGTPGRLGDLRFPRSKKSCVYMQYFKSRALGYGL